MIKKTWIVSHECRLNDFLRNELPQLFSGKDVSNGKIRRLIVAGCIFVRGRQCRIPAYELMCGDKISAEIDGEKFFHEKQPDDIDFVLNDSDVLFEDDFIIIVNKPAFLPSEGTVVENRRSMHSCVIDYLWKKNPSLRNPPYAGIMHRLDRETSGVLLFTKTRNVNKAVSEMFVNHEAVKIYRAVSTSLPSCIKKEKFVVEESIGRISAKSARCRIGKLSESKGGQPSKTEFSLIGKNDGLFYFDCRLFTGRTHQIRVHLSDSGYPILGDILYGGKKSARIMLHAMSLAFPHPISGQMMKIEAPLPENFMVPDVD